MLDILLLGIFSRPAYGVFSRSQEIGPMRENALEMVLFEELLAYHFSGDGCNTAYFYCCKISELLVFKAGLELGEGGWE